MVVSREGSFALAFFGRISVHDPVFSFALGGDSLAWKQIVDLVSCRLAGFICRDSTKESQTFWQVNSQMDGKPAWCSDASGDASGGLRGKFVRFELVLDLHNFSQSKVRGVGQKRFASQKFFGLVVQAFNRGSQHSM